MAIQLANMAARQSQSSTQIPDGALGLITYNLIYTGALIIGEFPVGVLIQPNEVFCEENGRCNLTFHDLALLVIRGDITPKNWSELGLNLRRGTYVGENQYSSGCAIRTVKEANTNILPRVCAVDGYHLCGRRNYRLGFRERVHRWRALFR